MRPFLSKAGWLMRDRFEKIHAQFVRRAADGLEVEFVSRHELRYSKSGRSLIFFIETLIADDGAPDGVTVNLSDLHLDSDLKKEIELDLAAAAVPLMTKFHIR